MDMLTLIAVAFAWTIIAFSAGVIVHWIATRDQRRLLKYYQRLEQQRMWRRSSRW